MAQHLRASRCRGDDGMTFIEITTVVLVVGVLLLVGIPAFLGAKEKANDRSAQVSIRQAFSNARAILADTDSYTGVTLTALRQAETSLRFTTADSDGPGEVSVDTSASGLVLAARSKSGLCFALGDPDNEAGVVFQNLGAFAHCSAADVLAVTPLPTAVPAAATAVAAGGWARGF